MTTSTEWELLHILLTKIVFGGEYETGSPPWCAFVEAKRLTEGVLRRDFLVDPDGQTELIRKVQAYADGLPSYADHYIAADILRILKGDEK